MILPASLMRIRVVGDGRKRVNLWIPLILIWPIVLALMMILSPVALLLCIFWPKGRKLIIAGPRVLLACWAMRGLELRVNDGDDQVLVSFNEEVR